jgi:hypothetical protein
MITYENYIYFYKEQYIHVQYCHMKPQVSMSLDMPQKIQTSYDAHMTTDICIYNTINYHNELSSWLSIKKICIKSEVSVCLLVYLLIYYHETIE